MTAARAARLTPLAMPEVTAVTATRPGTAPALRPMPMVARPVPGAILLPAAAEGLAEQPRTERWGQTEQTPTACMEVLVARVVIAATLILTAVRAAAEAPGLIPATVELAELPAGDFLAEPEDTAATAVTAGKMAVQAAQAEPEALVQLIRTAELAELAGTVMLRVATAVGAVIVPAAITAESAAQAGLAILATAAREDGAVTATWADTAERAELG